MTRVGLVGFGRIGGRVAKHLGPDARIVAVLARERGGAARYPDGAAIVRDVESLIEAGPEIVLEAASPAALRASGEAVVRAGIDLLPLSLCACLDDAFMARLRDAVGRPGAGRVMIPPGAMAALEGLVAARSAGLDRVVYRTVKPVEVWRRTAAAELVDLDRIVGETTILRGTVRSLADRFPDNLNVAVGVALAGLGPDRTEMELLADPASRVTIHELEFWAAPGHVKLRIVGNDPDPLTDCADYTAFSVLHALRTRSGSCWLAKDV